jgi:hypothetical protein
MKEKFLSFPFINFSESGLFKGLQAKKIKKFLARRTRVPGCAPNMSNSARLHSKLSSRRARVTESSIDILAAVSGFGKQNILMIVDFPESPFSVTPQPGRGPRGGVADAAWPVP